MPKKAIPLTVRKIETLKAINKPQTFFDGDGLFLYVPEKKYTNGKLLPASKLWRFKFTFQGKVVLMSFGAYPAMSLHDARERRQDARTMLANGINPNEARRQQRADEERSHAVQGNTFERVAMEWYNTAKSQWSDGHAVTILSRLKRDVFPPLGKRLISEITAADILAVLRLVEARQAFESAHRIKTIIGQVFTFAIVSSIPDVVNNPAAGLGKALKQPIKKNMAAILEPDKLGMLLLDIDGYAGSFVVICALKLAPMLFVRPGELRHAMWRDIDLEKAVWQLPIEATKLTLKEKASRKGQTQTIPLSRQAVMVLRELYPFTSGSEYVFPGRSASRVMSENTINQALRTLGYNQETITGHGFRATARTMLHERLGFSPDAIEAQLGHTVPDRLGSAYNRAKHLEERIRMMQAWSDFFDSLKAEVKGALQNRLSCG